MKKILVVFGTRPEAIKMAVLAKELSQSFSTKICVTGQHREMLDQVLDVFDVKPDYDLNIMNSKNDLCDITGLILNGVRDVLKDFKPDFVLVHGDTTTALSAATAAFYQQIPVAHIEAGLRTYNLNSPFPEEFNRRVISLISTYHFAPTNLAKKNLLKELKLEDNIYVTGNTVVDSLQKIVEKYKNVNFKDRIVRKLSFLNSKNSKNSKIPKIILVTGHRRESFGKGFKGICHALKEIALNYPDIKVVYPVHLNPNVSVVVNDILSKIDNVYLIPPLDYVSFVKLMNISYLILTDSGGIQEEATSLGKPVLVMRDTTERPEAIEFGVIKLVGTNKESIVSEATTLLEDENKYLSMAKSSNIYGDGHSNVRIRKILEKIV